jgi:hypothetical protein
MLAEPKAVTAAKKIAAPPKILAPHQTAYEPSRKPSVAFKNVTDKAKARKASSAATQSRGRAAVAKV